MGDIASLVALIIAIVGFAVTVWQVLKSKEASEQARDAAQSAKQQVLLMNAVFGLEGVMRDLQEIQRLQRDSVWTALPDMYTSVKVALIRIKGRTSELTELQQSEIQAAIQQISALETEVEGAIDGTNVPRTARMNTVLARQIERLAAVGVALQKEL